MSSFFVRLNELRMDALDKRRLLHSGYDSGRVMNSEKNWFDELVEIWEQEAKM